MNELQIFNNEQFGEIRAVELNGEPWFVGKDVAEALGYKDTVNALKSHVDPDDKQRGWQITTPSGKQDMTIINESGLYSLVLSSKLPNAKKFKRWITTEVIPSIRKHGAYMTPDTMQRFIADPDFAIGLLTALKDEQAKSRALEAENEKQSQLLADYEPKVQYLETILQSEGTMTTAQIAADYGMSAIQLNQILHDSGIQRKVNGQWILYRKYMGKGYTKSETINITRSDGRPDTKMHTRWTQKGRLMIHEVLTARGIKARMDK
jgi:prophage antirepressor-like protein